MFSLKVFRLEKCLSLKKCLTSAFRRTNSAFSNTSQPLGFIISNVCACRIYGLYQVKTKSVYQTDLPVMQVTKSLQIEDGGGVFQRVQRTLIKFR